MGSNTRRTLLKAFAAAGLLEGAGLSGLISQALAKGNNPVATGLYKITGSVLVNGTPASVGMLIKPGDTVTTGATSAAIYEIGQDAFLQRDNSSVVFGDDASAFFRVVTGKILSVFGHGQKKLHVATATIGIRGTGCYIESTPEKTYFCLCYGEAQITPTAAPEQAETLATKHHDHPLTISRDASAGSIMVAAPVINHTDIELTLLENIVGRRPPFGSFDIDATY